jgi:uncharacterized protein YdeI (YjbR/CyaY-like superfamily)
VAQPDAVEEVLCFGWIDSIVRRLDDERYVQRFTPRKDTGARLARRVLQHKDIAAANPFPPARRPRDVLRWTAIRVSI